MSYEPLLPLEEDFVSSISSRARAGEFGCWIDVEKTRMMTISVQHGKSIPGMDSWFGLGKLFNTCTRLVQSDQVNHVQRKNRKCSLVCSIND
jgi:hypothetical protein